jgi:glucokinase
LGDIGGTNFRLRLVTANETLNETEYLTKTCTSFKAAIDSFLGVKPVPDYIVLAIRGVILNGECATDFKGESEARLAEQYGGKPIVRFINDVEGMAWGVLKEQDYFVRLSHPNTVVEDVSSKPRVLFTMGTGTGMSLILPYGPQKHPVILPTETWAT